MIIAPKSTHQMYQQKISMPSFSGYTGRTNATTYAQFIIAVGLCGRGCYLHLPEVELQCISGEVLFFSFPDLM
jgi:hypothetical protein